MQENDNTLPDEIKAEAETLFSKLYDAGWIVSSSAYSFNSFGNWYVELSRAGSRIRIAKDRYQYLIEGSPEKKIKAAGLWRAFNNYEDFRHAVIKWLAS
jgi:hypothetical protein